MRNSRADQRRSVRIIAGQWRGRRLAIPRGTTVRPTPDRVRETAFNWLADSVIGSACLDLFAGTGALGLEALSRGAREVWLVENDAALIRALRSIVEELDAASAKIVQSDAHAMLRKPAAQSFDVVFLDPPYAEPLEPLLAQLGPWLADTACIYVERPYGSDSPEPLEQLSAALPGSTLVKQSRAAAVAYGLLRFERP
ncbi:MAG: 16S rRNA (guanine(966)-N(2))-methyltransferase RsmD [Gammaproteobacteria bacterium]|nr:16S rRNA (guanine(966)-N(2))-methyltransferase RsmD [Gammaproteobacteria bacterium]